MGRRSRNRTTGPATATPGPRPRTTDGIGPARRLIAAYLFGAAILGLLTLLGIAAIGGTFGPVLVFLVVLTLALTLQRTIARRIEGLELAEEDRLMRLLATGVLVTAVVLSLISAALSLVL